MPKLILTLNTQLPQDSINMIATNLTSLTQTLLNKQPEVTRIHVNQNQSPCFVNASLVTESPAFDLAIYITKGTNTDAQKSEWLSATYHFLSNVLGENTPTQPNYISIIELDAASWGYNGLSQFTRNNPV
ncbi:hypothetical protein [Photobacterium nomapromontoriensis]|uniref:hypothetical protein n=1 Tax=Photobacterium nomapromontoriensis TaxID=2910237 RepID=UPI003D0AA656